MIFSLFSTLMGNNKANTNVAVACLDCCFVIERFFSCHLQELSQFYIYRKELFFAVHLGVPFPRT